MSLTKEDLQALSELTKGIVKEEIAQSERRINARFDKVEEKLDFLESCINEAAKDTQLSIKRHEAEFHSA